ncbi:MAG: hypothetical protein ACQER0_08735 [Bacillota bacterium]
MTRAKILKMKENKLLKLIKENFGIELNGLDDSENLSKVWTIAEELMEKDWRIDIIINKNSKRVDGMFINKGKPKTLFARYGKTPEFRSITEGICKIALIIIEEE